MKRTPESFVMKAVTDFLDAKRVFWLRLNAGDRLIREYNGKKYRVRGHAKGTADLLALAYDGRTSLDEGKTWLGSFKAVWIEVKAPGGKQRPTQKEFQEDVEAREHTYLLIEDVDVLRDWFKRRGL